MQQYQDYFNDATRRILHDVDMVAPDAHDFVARLRSGFTLPSIRMVMVPCMYALKCYPSQGFCEIASLAFIDKAGLEWNLMGIGFKDWSGGPHFFVQHRITGA